MSARALPFALVALACLLLAPHVLAEHESSHRLEIRGRVVDAAGEPVPGAEVRLALDETLGEPPRCLIDAPAEDKTNETGDFHLCRHVHELDAPVRATVRVGEAVEEIVIDPRMRRAYVPIRLDEDWPVDSIQGQRAFDAAFVVSGRVVDAYRERVNVDGVEVNASPRAGARVNVTLLGPDGGELARAEVVAGAFGDYWAHLLVREVPEGARVRVDLSDATRTVDAPVELRRADVAFLREPAPAADTVPLPGSESGRLPAPGAAWVAVAVGGAALLLGRTRRR